MITYLKPIASGTNTVKTSKTHLKAINKNVPSHNFGQMMKQFYLPNKFYTVHIKPKL